jgi:hypothetical protein
MHPKPSFVYPLNTYKSEPVRATSPQRPHPLQMPDNRHIRIHIPIHAILHTRLFAPTVQLARRDFARDAFPEAYVCERVHRLLDLGFLA